ncbi:P-loop containing nucleoside triphosphate hydrolase protein [Aspergillus filifer]
MEEVYQSLVARALQLCQQKQGKVPSKRVIIALGGPSSAAKSTIAATLIARLNSLAIQPFAILLPMDGAYPAHWSFDAAGVLLLVKALALSRTTEKGVIKAPPFGPAIGDPVEETIAVSPEISLVFLEGEHSAYGQSPWAAFEHLVDDTWFLDDNIEAMKQRLGEISLESESARNRENAVGTLNYAHIPDDVEMQTNATQPAVMTRSAVGPLG